MVASVLIQTLNGLASASLLFLVALGLTLIFGVTRIVNFAHGSFTMLGAYIAVTLYDRLGGGALPALIQSRMATSSARIGSLYWFGLTGFWHSAFERACNTGACWVPAK